MQALPVGTPIPGGFTNSSNKRPELRSHTLLLLSKGHADTQCSRCSPGGRRVAAAATNTGVGARGRHMPHAGLLRQCPTRTQAHRATFSLRRAVHTGPALHVHVSHVALPGHPPPARRTKVALARRASLGALVGTVAPGAGLTSARRSFGRATARRRGRGSATRRAPLLQRTCRRWQPW